MKTTCIQMDMLFAQPEENFAKAKRLIRNFHAVQTPAEDRRVVRNTYRFHRHG